MNALNQDSLALSPERRLLQLSLELAEARENLGVVEAFGRFLKERFRPKDMAQADFDPKGPHLNLVESRQLFTATGPNFTFVLHLSLPVIFSLNACEGAAPAADELFSLNEMIRIFRERMESLAELKGLTYTDDLTGLYNQRYLELILDRELSLAKRNNTLFSVLFLDLDHFKAVNDTHGHLIGSRLLFEVGQEIKRGLRESDICFRYGGDEFVIILSHTGLDDAVFVAERTRVAIEKKRFLARDNMDIRLTASIGVASVPLHAITKSQILKAADEALYGVKKAVRNSVIAATAVAK
ncbi:MAG: GGDEF domain-containing protein, partial [Proteobacteria bacterium]